VSTVLLPSRPHLGEPLSLDLIDTQWRTQAGLQDALITPAATRIWLMEHHLWHPGLKLNHVHETLHEVRRAMRGVLEQPANDQFRQALNAALACGTIIDTLGLAGPEQSIQVPDNDRPAWLAARNLLELLRDGPTRIKRCANEACVLYFYDTSPKNARRWHDMKICGNRAKAARHYQRRHADRT